MRSLRQPLLASFLPLVAVAAAACASAPVDSASQSDAEAGSLRTQAPQETSAALPFVGLYATHEAAHQEGDLTSLQLLASTAPNTVPAYVRERCYHEGCAQARAESAHYDVYTSSSGKTYVRFWSVALTHDAHRNLVSTPTIADVYEIRAVASSGIELRKSYTSRWFSLDATTVDAQCTKSHGLLASGACVCPENVAGQPPTQAFAPGAGGCIALAHETESNCDDSQGVWTDDDATPTGAYCTCGVSRHVDDSGRCLAD